MKVFPNLRTAILKNITEIIQNKNVLDSYIQKQFKANPKWGSKDRKTIAQCTYDIVRHYEFLMHFSESKEMVLDTYLNFLNEENQFDFEALRVQYEAELPFETLYSVPSLFAKLGEKELGENFQAVWKAMHKSAPIFLRVNQSQTTLDIFTDTLSEHGIEFEVLDNVQYAGEKLKMAPVIKLLKPIAKNHILFEEFGSHFEIQDLGSQFISQFSDISKAKKIIESCAGNGGKSTHILDLTAENTQLVSFDIEESKLKHLDKRVARMFGKKVKTELANDANMDKYKNFADVLFMDVPCSGSGTIRRQADLKYRIYEAPLIEKWHLQKQIIENFVPTLKSGGKLIYSTCSIFPSENDDQVQWIESRGFTCSKKQTLLPGEYEGDGFFVAELIKN
jgi:16S rRNA (cytosine967-C5)-methyltransferase